MTIVVRSNPGIARKYGTISCKTGQLSGGVWFTDKLKIKGDSNKGHRDEILANRIK
jgi:hypothetical protein